MGHLIKETKEEAESRVKEGWEKVSIKELEKRFLAFGYKIEPYPFTSVAHYVSGPRKGKAFLHKGFDVIEIDTNLSAWNCQARRDGNFKKMQKLRNEIFSYHKRVIFDV